MAVVMKISTLSVLASLLLTSVAVAGCAAHAASEEAGDPEDVGAVEDELSTNALRGSYLWLDGLSGDFTEFEYLSLEAGGTYVANVQAPPNVRCFRAPCTVPEGGTWSTYKVLGKQKLRLKPEGKPVRIYGVSYSAPQRSLELTRYGRSTTLFEEPLLTCASVLCGPGTTCEMKLPENGPPKAVCTPVAPTAPCVVTGCSGQICADEHRFSTCQYRPEYACYQSATCERQADGQCGWTETPELTACLQGSR